MEKNANVVTGSYQSPPDLNGDTRLIITFDEKKGGSKGVEWGFGRRSCYHCTNAGCVKVCPSGALSKDPDTGFTKVEAEKCIGCQYCASACPFKVPHHYGIGPTINKCTACLDRIEHDRIPACVKTCPPVALHYGPREEMLTMAKERLAVLQTRGYDKAVLYGEEELGGLHVIILAKYGLEAAGLPANPQISGTVGILDVMKPVAGVGVAALAAGLGISFLSGIGYKRDTLHYDEVAHDVVDLDTGEVVRHVDHPEEERKV